MLELLLIVLIVVWAIKSRRSHPGEYWLWRGMCLWQIGKHSAALISLDRAIQLKPENPSAYTVRGMFRTYLGDNWGALEDFSNATDLQASSNAYYNLSIARHLLGMTASALCDIDKALEIDADFYSAYYFRSYLRHSLGDRLDAIDDCQRAMTLEANGVGVIDADNVHGFYYRGIARVRMGYRDGAIADLKRAAQICQRLRYRAFERTVADALTQIRELGKLSSD